MSLNRATTKTYGIAQILNNKNYNNSEKNTFNKLNSFHGLDEN
jgi:hypothetical protein